jgi:hypothetical protein
MARGAKAKMAKRETYYDRWRKQHVRVSFYFNREEYEKLKELASLKNMTVKEFVMSLMEGFSRYYDDVYQEGHDAALKSFCVNPHMFFLSISTNLGKEFSKGLGIIALPCEICGEPALIDPKHGYWEEAKRVLEERFGPFIHACCSDVREGKRDWCFHIRPSKPEESSV